MDTEMHEVVHLLIARMKSHPEEFGRAGSTSEVLEDTEDRWWRVRAEVMEYGTPEENAAVLTAMRKLKLKVAHEWMMDELCNGEERRRKQREDEDRYKMQKSMLARQQTHVNNINTNMKQASDYYTKQALSQLNALGNYTASTDLAQNAIIIKNHDTHAVTQLNRDDLATDNSPITTIKKALGL